MNKYIKLGIIVLLALLTMLGIACVVLKSTISEEQSKAILKIVDFEIKDRICIKQGETIYLGNSKKEIFNDFYDVKVVNKESSVDIYLNKLWYENYGQDFIQDEYLARICRKIIENFEPKSNKEEAEYMLFKYIKDNYVQVRDNAEVQKVEIENMVFSLVCDSSMAKLIIEGM